MTEHGSRLDPWHQKYAARSAGMVASEVRALFSVVSRPEIVSLAGGMPNVSHLPLASIGDMVASMLATEGAKALQYGSAQGDVQLREAICEVMALEGIEAEAENVIVTVGSQQALDLLARIFIDPGDIVLTEGPTYVTAIGTFSSYQAEIIHLAMDEAGLIPAALREMLAQLKTQGRIPKLLYTVPTFQNPTGVSLSVARRAEIIEICESHGILIIEDNPYGLLGFDAQPLPALRSMCSSNSVIYLGSFSKTLAPGLRVGWALAPPAVRDKLVLAAESAMLSHSCFTQMVVLKYLSTHPWMDQLTVYRTTYQARFQAMQKALIAHMPDGVHWTSPEGGFFVWMTLPEGLNSKQMLPRAIESRVAYVPGTGFYADGSGQRNIRLSFCFPALTDITLGVERLAKVIQGEIDLRNDLQSIPVSSDFTPEVL